MRSTDEQKSFEEMAIERDRELERAAARASGEPGASAAAAEEPGASKFTWQPTPPDYGVMRVSEPAAVAWGTSAVAKEYAPLVERMLSRIWHSLYAMDEQRHEIVRLRESTRGVLARLARA